MFFLYYKYSFISVLYDNFMGHLMPSFIMLNLFSAVFMLCNSAFEQSNVDLRGYIHALIITCCDPCTCVSTSTM